MITQKQQDTILSTINAVATAEHLNKRQREERRRFMMFGVLIALGQDQLPPFWVINITCGRIDRIFETPQAAVVKSAKVDNTRGSAS